MRSYTAEKYRSLVEETADPRLQRYMDEERSFIARIPGVDRRTMVDLGAGHGRVLGDLAHLGERVVAIEINPDMYRGLARRAASFANVTAIQGDILDLARLLDGETVEQPVFLILQNSIGTIEGDDRALLRVVRAQMENYDGTLVLSLLRRHALPEWGVEMYATLRDMVGDADLAASDFASGRFVTETGYTSKWWSDAEIDAFKQLGEVEDEVVSDEYHLVRLGVPRREVAA